jgi:hypothetical protein
MKSNFSLVLAIVCAVLLNLFIYSIITTLLRATSDAKVYGGLALAILLLVADIIFIKKLIRRP